MTAEKLEQAKRLLQKIEDLKAKRKDLENVSKHGPTRVEISSGSHYSFYFQNIQEGSQRQVLVEAFVTTLLSLYDREIYKFEEEFNKL